jgi:hypothetical protein
LRYFVISLLCHRAESIAALLGMITSKGRARSALAIILLMINAIPAFESGAVGCSELNIHRCRCRALSCRTGSHSRIVQVCFLDSEDADLTFTYELADIKLFYSTRFVLCRFGAVTMDIK